MIKDQLQSPYTRNRYDEALPRTILDLILIDRLRSLQDKDAYHQLCLSAEVPVSIKTRDINDNYELVWGRADWALGYGRTKAETGSILIVVEAKPFGKASIGLPQLIVYMTAVFESRRDRNNNAVFGMMSDAVHCKFAFLDHNKKLYVSIEYPWFKNESTILAYIDNILLDAIRSSPNTTLEKTRNTSLELSSIPENNGGLVRTRRTRRRTKKWTRTIMWKLLGIDIASL